VARYAQGQPVRLSTEVKDATGAYATPGSILLRVKKPDGTFLADYTSPTADALGKYHQDIGATDLAALGHYQYAWITTGTAAGVSPPASFEVVDPFAPTHITWSDVLERLGLTTATLSASQQAELQGFMASAVATQEKWVGAIAPRSVTETVYPDGGLLWLSTRPVMSITSATYNGSPVLTVGSWVLGSPLAGTVGWPSYGFYGSTVPYVVTYVAGRNPVPPDLVTAALDRVAADYETQRSPAGLPVSGLEDGATSTAYPLILRAQDKERPYLLSGLS
jgi:hypothetical protein